MDEGGDGEEEEDGGMRHFFGWFGWRFGYGGLCIYCD